VSLVNQFIGVLSRAHNMEKLGKAIHVTGHEGP
jgi:hypothetical protein